MALTSFRFHMLPSMTTLCALAMMRLRYTVARNFGGNDYSGNTTHISVTNSILQPDVAHPINIGTHGDPTAAGGGDTIEDLNFLEYWTIWK